MSRQPRNQAQTVSFPTSRQNEYFVPRDGIDREVISADICRYLGNDALVRPGHYENAQTGQVVQGYYITAYRNLTTAMIEDLKADSARWDSERRAQTARNTQGGQYRYSETHQSRQNHGPTELPYAPDPYGRDSYDGPRYPGTGTSGYHGASSYQQQQHQQHQQQPPSQQQQQGYASGGALYGGYQQGQQGSHADMRFASPQASSMMGQGYQLNADGSYVATGANMPPRNFSNEPFPQPRMTTSVSSPPQPIYASSAPTQPAYPTPAPTYPYANQALPPTSQPFAAMQQSSDAYYGRASPSGPNVPPSVYPAPTQQYDDPSFSRTSTAPAAKSQTPSAGPSSRLNDRNSDRHSAERHTRPPPPRR